MHLIARGPQLRVEFHLDKPVFIVTDAMLSSGAWFQKYNPLTLCLLAYFPNCNKQKANIYILKTILVIV